MKLEELRIPPVLNVDNAKEAVMAFIDAIHEAKHLNDWVPIQGWLDAYAGTPADIGSSEGDDA